MGLIYGSDNMKGVRMKKLFDYLRNAYKSMSVGVWLLWSDYAVFVALGAVIYALVLREIL